MVTFSLTVLMCAGLFLLLWGAVGFVQDKRFFSSAPKEIQEAVQPKPERFAGQHVLGWCMLILALAMMLGAVVLSVTPSQLYTSVVPAGRLTAFATPPL